MDLLERPTMDLTAQSEIISAKPEDYVVLAYVTDQAGLAALLDHESPEHEEACHAGDSTLVTFRSSMGMASAEPGIVCYVAVKRRYLAEGQPAGCWWCRADAPYTLLHRPAIAVAA